MQTTRTIRPAAVHAAREPSRIVASGVPRRAGRRIVADRRIDRSPTGWGTAGRPAPLHGRGEAPVTGPTVGTGSGGRAPGERTAGGMPAPVHEVCAPAPVRGVANRVPDARDRLRDGFPLR